MDNKTSPNFYEILGVAPDCSKDTIRKKYRELAKKTHPDKGGSSELFEMIVTAYETLNDPETRKEYDELCNIIKQSSITHFDLRAQAQNFYKDNIIPKNIDKIEVEKDDEPIDVQKKMEDIELVREQDDIENLHNNLFANGKFDITQFNTIFDNMKKNEITSSNEIIKYNKTEPTPWNFEIDDIPCQSLELD